MHIHSGRMMFSSCHKKDADPRRHKKTYPETAIPSFSIWKYFFLFFSSFQQLDFEQLTQWLQRNFHKNNKEKAIIFRHSAVGNYLPNKLNPFFSNKNESNN